MIRMSKKEDVDLQLMYVIMQPTRQRILKALRDAKDPMYIAEIASKIGEEARTVSFHVATLAEYGLVEGEYREIGPHPTHSAVSLKAAKFYRLTPKLDDVMKRLATHFRSTG